VPELPPTAAVVSPPPPLTIEQLSPSADQAALLRELATRLHGQKAEPTLRYAGFFLRVFAFLIDAVVLGAFGVPLAAAGYFGLRAGTAMLGHAVPVDADETLLTILMLAWFVMATIYFTVLHRRYGQTIGKSLVGIEVRTLELEKLGVARSLLRTLGYGLSSTFFGFGFFLVALTPRKRAWHDFLAGTCVVRQLPEEAPA
jgi:uncharacterized RDD family membrane protein YckC